MPRIHLNGTQGEYLDCTLTQPKRTPRTDTLVIYLHGFASHQRGEKVLFLRNCFNRLGAAFLAFDHRGHGSSSGTMEELTVSRNLEDLDAVFRSQARGFQNRVLIGSSMGGQTAAWYSAAHPDSVSANLLIAPGFRFLEHRLRDLGPQKLRILKQQGTITIKNKWISVTIGKSLLKDARSFSVEKLLKIYRTPTLILHGTKDDSVPFADSVDFAARARVRPVELVLIGGGDHRLTEHKAALFAHMRTFCERMGIRPLRGGGTGRGVARNARKRS